MFGADQQLLINEDVQTPLLGNKEGHIFFKIIWSSLSRLKHKIFFWLIAHDRVNTRNMLMRRGMHLDDFTCPNYS